MANQNGCNNPDWYKPGQKTPAVCLTLHQPWASLLVYGIKRIEGRNWPTNYRGTCWIHAAAGHEPTKEEIEELEERYTDIFSLEGVRPKFPKAYPTGCLLGTVDIVACVPSSLFSSPLAPEPLTLLPASIQAEASECSYSFLCENPQRLAIFQQALGKPKFYSIPFKVSEQAALALMKPDAVPLFSFTSFMGKQGLDLVRSISDSFIEEERKQHRAGRARGDDDVEDGADGAGPSSSASAPASKAQQQSEDLAKFLRDRESKEEEEAGLVTRDSLVKRQRKIEKKLREIGFIEAKINEGRPVEDAEREKAAQRPALEEESLLLSLQLAELDDAGL